MSGNYQMTGKTKQEIYKEVYIKMMMKYGDDPFYKEVLDGLFEGESSTKKAIDALISVRGDQAFKNLRNDIKNIVNSYR